MAVEPRVAALAASGILGMIGRYGGDPDRIIGAARLDLGALLNPEGSVDLRGYCDLFEHAARQTGVASFGLRFGTQYRLESMGPLGELILNAATLGDALRSLCRYFPAIQEHSTMRLRATEGLLALEYQIRDGRIAQRRQDAELTIGMFAQIFTRACGAGWGAEEIHFEHLRGDDAAGIRAVLHAPVYFGAPSNAILFRRDALETPMPGANPARLPALQAALNASLAIARPDDFIGGVVQEIRQGFGRGAAGIDDVAARLGFSRAALYRRLAAEGTDFSTLTEQARKSLAIIYVSQPGIAFTDIAPLLGYSELSAFSRAFTRWTGLSPARYRTRRAAQPESAARCS